MSEEISGIDWQRVTEELNEKGYALVSRFLPVQYCDELIGEYDNSNLYRKTITMERHRFGLGEYKYFKYPLPDLIHTARRAIYPKLAPVANTWMKVLDIKRQFPDQFDEFQRLCHDNNQTKPTVLILKYGKGGHNTLHQDLYGNIFFPFQLVLFLNEPDDDYTGGEFVLTQHTPRAQSKAIVLRPSKGDMLILTTNFRPVKGSKGYYRVQMKHGISEVHDGNRHTLGVIFHDALS
ncbi:MAG: prolyl 4-hydroxylase subunit alpha [Candidatus Nitrosopolaris wilkensis]|nr:MAG: prolyl 4-hydroxylase subunit alpha [Candidatus Nitrosopolaris wilkensis]